MLPIVPYDIPVSLEKAHDYGVGKEEIPILPPVLQVRFNILTCRFAQEVDQHLLCIFRLRPSASVDQDQEFPSPLPRYIGNHFTLVFENRIEVVFIPIKTVVMILDQINEFV